MASIDLMKIDKSKIITHANGCKYLNIDITVNDEKDQYQNDVSVALSQTKDERDAKLKKTYLGNGKTVWESVKKETTQNTNLSKEEDDLPF